jgi:alpha-mannosidase
MNLDWQERNLMVKVAFPANVKNGEVACEIPFGAILRAADGTEVPALRWVDAADDSGDYGLSLLNDSRYGFDVKNNMMRMSIIHGAVSPDPEADRGSHELLYSLYPHRGTWKEAGTLRRASEINNPLLARQVMAHKGQLSAAHSFIQAEPDNVVVSCLKKEMGYYGRGVILRLYEAFGKPAEIKIQFPWPVEAQETDLIERPLKKLDSRGKTLSLSLNPYEIKTLRISKSGQ